MLDNNVLKGQWNDVKGDVKRFFGKLTDDDLLRAEGNKDKLLGALQKRYGYNQEEAELRWGEFTDSVGDKWNKAMDRFDNKVDQVTKKIANDR